MKKAYVKPGIVFEDFSLSASISVGCEFTSEGPSPNQCAYKDDRNNRVVFVEGVDACVYKQPDTNDQLCYDVPNADYNIFNS